MFEISTEKHRNQPQNDYINVDEYVSILNVTNY